MVSLTTNQFNINEFIDSFLSLSNPLFLALLLLVFFLFITVSIYRNIFRPMRKKHIEEKRELELKNIKLMALFSEINPNPLLRVDRQGNILYSNKFADYTFGFDFKKEKIHLSAIIPQVNINLAELIDADKKREEILTINGQFFAATFVGISYLDIINIYFYDITKLKEAEAKLIEYKNRLKGLTRWQENLIEKERGKIAGDLHDSIGQQISLLKMQLQNKAEKLFSAPEELNDLYNAIDNLNDDIRQICYELKPQLLEELGLFAAVKMLVSRVNSDTEISGKVNLFGKEQRLDNASELTIYRVIQESINNILKHSQANSFSVQLIYTNELLKIIISDDGKGFDPQKTISLGGNKGFGLLNMTERIENIEGTINFNSAPGDGAVVIIEKKLTE